MWGHARNQSPVFFCVNMLLARPVGHENNFKMNILKPGEIDPDNIINVTMEDLNDAQRQLLLKTMDDYQ
jgi:hypothetical protein